MATEGNGKGDDTYDEGRGASPPTRGGPVDPQRKRYRRNVPIAMTPSRGPIFLPSARVRGE